MKTEQKVVLITGGGSGLGKGMADEFVRRDLRVSVTVRDEEGAPREDGILVIAIDMRDHVALPKIVEKVVEHYGRLDALICNAAVQGFGHVSDIDAHQWQETLDVNLTAPFLLAQAAAPHLAKTGGLIAFVSSVHGVLAAPSRTMYAVGKAGLIAMARNMAADLSPDGVRVVSLVLGPFASPALAQGVSRFFPTDTPEAAINKFSSSQPLGRIGSAAELAELVLFLMSDAAGFITGTSITIDGGQSSRLAVPDLKAQAAKN